jgi:hypothetical protein
VNRHPRDAAIHARHDNIEQDPLPIEVAPADSAREASPRRRSVPSVAFGTCPVCEQPEIGQIAASSLHNVWREHFRTTGRGVRLRCRMSGQAVLLP